MITKLKELYAPNQNDLASLFFNNAFEVQSGPKFRDRDTFKDPDQQIRSAVYPTLARINHSCVPNATCEQETQREKFLMRLRATEDIPNGREVTIDYIGVDGYPRTNERQQALRDTYHFTCSCALCVPVVIEPGRGARQRARQAPARR